jgi:predicted nucleic acid-binding protein
MIVVDANVMSFYLIKGERTPDANSLRDLDAEWIVPSFWCIEFQSILRKYVRFGGMPTEKALQLLDQATAMFSVNEVTPPPDTVLRDALTWGITVYDAQYVSLAKQMGIRCVTEDGCVQDACAGIALSIEDFIGGASGRRVVREPKTKSLARRRRKD